MLTANPIINGKSYRYAYINGDFVPEQEAAVSIFDTAIATGEVVVEITRTFNRIPFLLDAHLGRLYAGARELGIKVDLSLDDMRKVTQQVIDRNIPTENDQADWQIIHYVSKGLNASFGLFSDDELKPTCIITCFPLIKRIGKMASKYLHGVDLVVTPQRIIPADVLSPQIKSRGRLDYVLARKQAGEICPGSTGVLLDTNEYLAEGTGTTLYLIRDGALHTPPAYKVVNSVTRRVILEIAHDVGIPVYETELTVTDAETSDEMFETSTVICMVHARSFNGKLIGDSFCGRITNKIRNVFIQKVNVDFVQQAQLYAKLIGG